MGNAEIYGIGIVCCHVNVSECLCLFVLCVACVAACVLAFVLAFVCVCVL